MEAKGPPPSSLASSCLNNFGSLNTNQNRETIFGLKLINYFILLAFIDLISSIQLWSSMNKTLLMKALTGSAIAATIIELATAATYTVAWDTSSNVQTWAANKTFFAGDKLAFQYTPSHNVLEVTKGDYNKCVTSNPLKSSSGTTTTVPLSSPGNRYFICGTPGHCAQGMKLGITTLAASTSPSLSPSGPSSAESPISPPSSSPSSTITPETSPPASSPTPTSTPNSPLPATSPAPSSSPARSPAKRPTSPPGVSSTQAVAKTPYAASSPSPSSANNAIFAASLPLGLCTVTVLLQTLY